MSLLFASFNELPVVEPLERQWLTDEVARLRLGFFGFFFFGHCVYNVHLTRYKYNTELREEKEREEEEPVEQLRLYGRFGPSADLAPPWLEI